MSDPTAARQTRRIEVSPPTPEEFDVLSGLLARALDEFGSKHPDVHPLGVLTGLQCYLGVVYGQAGAVFELGAPLEQQLDSFAQGYRVGHAAALEAKAAEVKRLQQASNDAPRIIVPGAL